ncbi:flavin reductase like domain-containing protein [Chaetomium tenue]|uniref:Flavin reductase like domain-containing protein n=1 Tax=Chaetomium tenue TaxID=1854479 RepID=A0ACB7PNP8_9PEZI|nr:flavin reductase like domain-containing protein [Chaetomium globosum]
MNSPRVLVGLAAERAPLAPLVPRRNHASSAWANPMQRPRTAAAQPPLAFGRVYCYPEHPPRSPRTRRCFHSTPQTHRDRHPRTFHLTDPQPPSIHSHSSSPASPPLPEQFRSVMRLLTHPVVVCTSTHPPPPTPTPNPPNSPNPPPPPQGTPRGMTMSSFTSLALAPTPVVSFNIATPSRTLDAVAASGRFNIHVLADDAAGARVADWFTGGNAEGRGAFERLVGKKGEEGEGEGGMVVVGGGAGGGGSSGGSSEEAPVLKGEGVLYVLRCRLLDDEPTKGLVKVRDHVIVLGEVLEIVEGPGVQREREERFGLLYADRRYRQLGGCITPEKELIKS